MFDLIRRAFVKLEVIASGTPTTQHGIAMVRAPSGEVQQLGIAVDRPEVLADADQDTIVDMFEQLGRQGYIPRSIEIATPVGRKSFEAPAAARVLENLQFPA